jgi:RNA methyltransferase, TrmH family
MRPDRSPRPIVVRPLSRPLTAELVQSLREPDSRRLARLFVAEGARFVAAAIEYGRPICGAVVCPPRQSSSSAQILSRKLHKAGVPVLGVSPPCFDELALGQDAQGILSLHPLLWEPLPKQVSKHDLWLGIERIRSPGNLGTLLRSAEAAGGSGLIAFGGSISRADPFDPVCVRASMGSIFAHRFIATSHRDFRRWSLRYELTVLGASAEAQREHRAVTYRRPTVLMMGDERAGLSDAQRETCDGFIKIPMQGRLDSLNVAMAGTVLLYEAYSQRHPKREKITLPRNPGASRLSGRY